MEQKIIKVKKNNIEFLVEDSQELHQAVDYNFWSLQYPTWENSTFQVLDQFLKKDKDYLDIGSWVGPTAIYASCLCRKVVAIEPDPVAIQILKKNINLNSIQNIHLIEKAASSLPNARLKSCAFYGDSMSRTSEDDGQGFEIETVGVDELMNIGDYSLIKIDIEGHEFDLIHSYSDVFNTAKIPLFLSLHSSFVEDSAEKLERLKKDLSTAKHIFNQLGEEISVDQINEGFDSYLFVWQ